MHTPSHSAARLIENGYRPVPCVKKRPVHDDWTKIDFTPEDFAKTPSVGIKTGQGIAFIDIDVTHPEASAAIVSEWLRRHSGGLQRTGLAPKTGFLVASDIGRKVEVKLPNLGEKDKIEVLTNGQQFIAYGEHPDTGKPYHWHGLDPLDGFLGVKGMLPIVSEAEIKNFLAWVAETYGPKKPLPKLSEQAIQGNGSYDMLGNSAAARPCPDEVAEILSHIPPDCSYADWLAVLMGLHEWSGGSEQGLSLADGWSSKGTKYKSGEVASKWKGFDASGGTKWATVAAIARANGADLSAIARKYRGRPNRTSSGQPGARPEQEPDADALRSNASDVLDLSQDAFAVDLGRRCWDSNARHVAAWGKWLFWTSTRWEVDEKLDHLTRVRVYVRDRAEELLDWAERKAAALDAQKEGGGAQLRRWARDQARNMRSKNTVTAVESLARSNCASVARSDAFDADRLLLGTPGGTVDLRTGQLRPAMRNDMITKLTACAPADPGSRPHLWLTFLTEIFGGDAELVSFMQRAAGYALTGLTTEHKLLFLHGTGRNGKSVFLNTLTWLWADYARRAAAETFLNTNGEKHSTGLAGLQGARLVAGSELPVGKTWDESVIKDLTGGDRMTARFMRGDFFDFDPQLTLMIAGNNQPSFRGVDEAIRARVVLVPFTVTISPEKRDKGLSDKLKAEGPAILRWAIDGALQWLEHGLDVPAKVVAASAEYMDDEDTLGQFVGDELLKVPGHFTSAQDLHHRFAQWCEGQGLKAWTQLTLIKELKTRGFEPAKSNGRRGLKGLKFA